MYKIIFYLITYNAYGEMEKKEKKSELEIMKDFMYMIKCGLTTYDNLKIGVEIFCVESVSLTNCWKGVVYFGDNREMIYETDISDLEYTMEKVRDYIIRNFKTNLDKKEII